MSLCLHSILFGLEAVQTNVFVSTFNPFWIGSGADQCFCDHIPPFLDWKGCRPTSLCSHSTLFGLEAVQTTVFVLTFSTLWIGSGADQRLRAYVQPFLERKRCQLGAHIQHSWIGSGAGQRLRVGVGKKKMRLLNATLETKFHTPHLFF